MNFRNNQTAAQKDRNHFPVAKGLTPSVTNHYFPGQSRVSNTKNLILWPITVEFRSHCPQELVRANNISGAKWNILVLKDCRAWALQASLGMNPKIPT